MKNTTQREVNAAASHLQAMQRAYGDRNMATERAWSAWFDLNERLKQQKADREFRKAFTPNKHGEYA